MKKFYFLLATFVVLLLNSCVYENDDYFINDYNQGEIGLNGMFLPAYEADLYLLETYPDNSKLYSLIVTENYTINGTVYSNVALETEIYKPYNTSLEGIYYLNSAYRSIDFVQYYRNATITNGVISSANFVIPSNTFSYGELRLDYIGNNRYHVDMYFETYNAQIVESTFEGVFYSY